MRTRFDFSAGSRLACALFVFILPIISHSATVRVPTDSATIQGAVDLANTGDTVLIENSGVYVESVFVAKVINLMAAPGTNPIIRYDVSNPTPVSYVIGCNAVGAVVGSSAGGQIILDGACTPAVTSIISSPVEDPGEVVFENFRLINGTPSRMMIYPFPPDPVGSRTGVTITFRDVIVEAAGCDPNSVFDDVQFPLRPDLLNGATWNLIRCQVTGARRMAMLHGGGDSEGRAVGKVNISESYISGRELAIVNEPERALPITWNVVDSVLESYMSIPESEIIGTFAPWWIRSSGQVVGATRTVFICRGNGRAFYTWPADDSILTFDHCDFILAGSGNPFQFFPPGLAAPRRISITNSNLVSLQTPADEGFGGPSGSLVANDIVTMNYNNVLGGYGPLEFEKPEIVGANDVIPPATPDYISLAPPDFNLGYTIPNLLVGDQFGGPVGSFLLFGDPPPPTPTPIPPSAIREWDLYE